MTISHTNLGHPSLTAQDPRFAALTIGLAYADPKAATIAKGVLDSLGCRSLVLIRDGSELLARTVAEPIDMAILDWKLRTCSGPESIRRLRYHTSHPKRDLPIIQLCPSESDNYRQVACDAGANDCVAKPFTARSILGTVYSVIERPKPFILSPNYIGPDRRRTNSHARQLSSRGETRIIIPTTIASIPDAISYGPDLVAVVNPDYALKKKMGLAHPEFLTVPDDILHRAESSLAVAKSELANEVEQQAEELLSLNRFLAQRPDRLTGTVRSIRQIAYWVECRSRELGYQRIPDVARLLFDFCDRHFVADNPNSLILLEKHALTLMAILRVGPEAARGPIGESLVRDLARQASAFKSV